jgi:molybdopterin-guanine dinucleotide biosynthesis protein A
MQSSNVCAVILAGGQSSRMGFNKAMVDIGGQPLIRNLIDCILPVTDQIFISSNDAQSYAFLDFPVISDHFPGKGPLAGFHSVMIRYNYALYILLACDLPNLKTSILQTLVSLAEGYDAVIPRTRDGIAHPLCAVYRRTWLPAVEKALARGANKMIQPFLDESLAVRWVTPDEGGFKESDLANINTPEDLRKLKVGYRPGSRSKLNM